MVRKGVIASGAVVGIIVGTILTITSTGIALSQLSSFTTGAPSQSSDKAREISGYLDSSCSKSRIDSNQGEYTDERSFLMENIRYLRVDSGELLYGSKQDSEALSIKLRDECSYKWLNDGPLDPPSNSEYVFRVESPSDSDKLEIEVSRNG